MKKTTLLLCCIPMILLAACIGDDENARAETIQPKTIEIGDGSELTIVPLYTQYQTYLEASLETNDLEQKKKLYRESVLDYISKVGEEENFETADLKVDHFMKSTSYEQQLLNQIDVLMSKHSEIEDSITNTYMDSHKELPKKKSTIFIVPINPEFQDMVEPLGGFTATAYKDAFVFYLGEEFDQRDLAYTTAHEYHHLILHDQPDFVLSSVFDSVITEGKADAFAERIVQDFSPPWLEPMDEATKERIASLVNDDETTYIDFVIGNEQKNLPRWSNYILGKDILDHYLESNPDLSIREWTFKEGHEILEGYKYQEILHP